MKSKKAWTLIELLVVIAIFAIIVGYVLGFVLLYKIGWKKYLEPAVYRNDYVLQAQNIADNLGSPERKGYRDSKWDDFDKAEMCKEMGIPTNTSVENIPSAALKKFVLSHKTK